MKKSLSLIFVFIFVFAFVSCGPSPSDTIYYYGTPKNGVYDAPEEFLLDWDIASVRDNSVTKDGYYSMPIYMFETYEEFLHLKDIVGMDEIGGEIDSTDYCSICGSFHTNFISEIFCFITNIFKMLISTLFPFAA